MCVVEKQLSKKFSDRSDIDAFCEEIELRGCTVVSRDYENRKVEYIPPSTAKSIEFSIEIPANLVKVGE